MTKLRLSKSNKVLIYVASFFAVLIGYNYHLLYAQPDGSPNLQVQIERIPDQKEIADLYNEAKNLYQKGDYLKAKEKFNKVLSINPERRDVMRYLIDIEKKLQANEVKTVRAKEKKEVKDKLSEEKEAKMQAEKAEKNKKDEIKAAYQKGEEFYKKGNYAEAKIKFQEVLRLNPNHREAKKYTTLSDFKIKETEKKANAITGSEQKKTDEAKAAYQKGEENYKKGDYDTARSQFEKILSMDLNNNGAKRYLALIEARSKEAKAKEKRKEDEEKRRGAIEAAKALIDKIKPIYQEGEVSYKNKDYQEAKIKFEEVLKLKPEHKGAQRYLRQIQNEEEKIRKQREKIEPPEATIPGGKLTIDDCVNIALKSYAPLQIADQQIALAKQKVKEATRNLFPAINLNWEDGGGTEYTNKDYTTRHYSVEGQQAIFHGGRFWYVLKQANLNLEIAVQNKKRLKSELVSSVKKPFYSLIKSKESLKQQEVLLSEVEKIFNSVSRQYQEGLCSELDFLDVQSKYNQVYFQYLSASEDLILAELILKQAMNVDSKQPIDIEYSLDFKKVPIDVESCLNLAFTNRADVRINELVTEFADYGKKITRSDGFPAIDLLGSYGNGAEWYENAHSQYEKEWLAGVKVKVPLGGNTLSYSFANQQTAPVLSTLKGTTTTTNSYKLKILDDLRYYSSRKEADIDYDQSKHELHKTKKEIMLELKEGFFNYEKAIIQLDAAKTKVNFQTKEAEILKLRRGFGEATDSQVVESLVKVAQEQYSYVQAITDYYMSIVSLNKAIGIDDYFSPDGKEPNNL
ncbi:MAG: hypothetical protein COS99_05600 [Candidatus Omnitrophica bacterium CG07_land_8_20_14_0_80_42_15]|uniref:Tetratricopeptide repeat protein n=1 Tax=Candidatus Aquitaenariimonas noxiae TaxID=1974741 RepID=A0A2J0KUF1_9BACT|nr:MAG: hypothetical protein COS99_05600 [Candidatus Omnitrophica bacterium CG07_land_8_20_14_0_80_42_15]